jgi:uncharacterized protein (DUF362 family)
MPLEFTRRSMFLTAGAAFLTPRGFAAPAGDKSQVALIKGDNRRKNVFDALSAIDDQIRPKLALKKSVVIKPNLVSTTNQLAATHVDTLQGILDYLAPRWKGPVFIAESSAGDTMQGYESFRYSTLKPERANLKPGMIDLNEEGKYEISHILDADLHYTPVRLAARLLDPDAFVICAAVMKTHNTVVATLSVKNMALGSPLHSAKGATPRFNDKRAFHGGVRQTHLGITMTAQRLKPAWGATVIDGFEGMEGNGPASGRPVPSRIAIASTDYIAADRIGVECMGIDPKWIGYLNFCDQVGVGNYSRDKIDVRGELVEKVAIKYELHKDIERELQWMGPMVEVPPKLG